MTEEILTGGVNRVIRSGDLVRRPAGPWAPLVHDLLRAVREHGFTAAPRPHRLAGGEEVLDFLPGEVSGYPLSPAAASEEALITAAELLRAYHDATVGYAVTAPREGWMLPAVEPVEVLCHGDYAPYNCVLTGDRVTGMIDFDVAHPGPRVWDVAYAAYRWVPLTDPRNDDGHGTAGDQARRLGTFVDHYRLDEAGRDALPEMVAARLEAMVAFMRGQAAAGNVAFAGHIAAGHDALYVRDAAYVTGHSAVFRQAMRR